MIYINNKPYVLQEKQNLRILLDVVLATREYRYMYGLEIKVIVNGIVVPEDQYESYSVKKEDNILIVPHMFGG